MLSSRHSSLSQTWTPFTLFMISSLNKCFPISNLPWSLINDAFCCLWSKWNQNKKTKVNINFWQLTWSSLKVCGTALRVLFYLNYFKFPSTSTAVNDCQQTNQLFTSSYLLRTLTFVNSTFHHYITKLWRLDILILSFNLSSPSRSSRSSNPPHTHTHTQRSIF